MIGARGKSALLAAVALLGADSLAACDDDEEESGSEESSASATGAEEVTVVATSTEDGYDFELSDTPTAKTKSIVLDNQDS